jgi:hypothetical protein
MRKLSLVSFSERFALRPPEVGVAEEEDDAWNAMARNNNRQKSTAMHKETMAAETRPRCDRGSQALIPCEKYLGSVTLNLGPRCIYIVGHTRPTSCICEGVQYTGDIHDYS